MEGYQHVFLRVSGNFFRAGRLKHITRRISRALDNLGPGNILRKLAKKTDRLKVDTLETKNAQMAAYMVTMSPELAQKRVEIHCYHAK
jgi:hypothetical protein